MPFLHLGTATLELPPGETVVGGGTSADWRLADQGLAPRHFVVTVGPAGEARLAPFSAQHVVVVAGRQVGIDGIELADGDTIAVGSARLVYTAQPGVAHAPPSETAHEAALVDERARRAIPLGPARVTIGRDRGSTIMVRDPAVSRFHAEVRAEAGRHVLHSSGSGGTRVNGRRISAPHVLEEGDVVEVGEIALRYTTAPPPGLRPWSSGAAPLDDLAERPTLGGAPLAAASAPRLPLVVRLGLAVAAVLGLLALGLLFTD